MNFSEASIVVNFLKRHINGLYFTGSYHRKENEINDIDIITMNKLDKVLNDFQELFGTDNIEVKKKGKMYMSIDIILRDVENVNLDIWYASNKNEFLMKKILRNLDKGTRIGWHLKARNKGYILSEEGLFKGDRVIKIKSLKMLKDLIGLK